VDQIGSLLKTLQDSVLGATIARSPWLFPTIETIHVVAISLVIGSIFILDLRLIGRLWTHLPVSKLAGQTLPWTWTSFIFAVISGSLMFTSNATLYGPNRAFHVKLILLCCAGLNMMFFHMSTYKTVRAWETQAQLPRLARVAGGLSLIFWTGVVAAGRWIGFTLN
jgi:hypothetical protein